MKYSREDYENFLNLELQSQINDYESIVNTSAINLKNIGEIFVGRFIKLQSSGIAIFKVRNSDNMPRKNSFWTASYFINEMGSFRNWGNLSWAEIRKKYQRICSDAQCVWIQQSNDSDFCIVGIKKLTLEFLQIIEKDKAIIAFGPKDPPLQYLFNLIDIIRDTENQYVRMILDYNNVETQWNPKKINIDCDFISLLYYEFQNNTDYIIIQGPPGTGKTYRMSQLIAKLLTENKSILFIALTNKSLMELAKKEPLKYFLEKNKISKTSLTFDESKELEKLLSNSDNSCMPTQGSLSLATFYVSSGWAKEYHNRPFDFVIMDEASQALLPMIAASVKLGKKVIWIGDQNQLSPIISINDDIINNNRWIDILNGFETICNNFNFKSYILCDTFRLTRRCAEFTGIFYNNSLNSVSKAQTIPSNMDILNINGGPSLIGIKLEKGDKTPTNAFDFIFKYTNLIIDENTNTTIAIVSKFRKTIQHLQKYFIFHWVKKQSLLENIFIETVDKIQGITVDYCFFLIPNTSLQFSLDNKLFNVATSRARYNTIIVADEFIHRQNMSTEIQKYILKAQESSYIKLR